MDDLSLFDQPGETRESAAAVVNVSSVPQRSPFRYPGGKTWLIPRVRQWLRAHPAQELIEPFAGGGIVSLTAVMENLVQRAVMVERDEDIAAVWTTILGLDSEWLADRIIRFELTPESLQSELSIQATSVRERAFQTILKNRTFRGGILADGSRQMKQGENGKGVGSRWYPGTLRKRILAISHYRDRISFIEGDGFVAMEAHRDRSDVAFFIDPPYTKAAKRLYRYPDVDHERLFALTEQMQGDFLMTYDNAEQVQKLAIKHRFQTRTIAMKNTHHTEQTELLIGRDLAWV